MENSVTAKPSIIYAQSQLYLLAASLATKAFDANFFSSWVCPHRHHCWMASIRAAHGAILCIFNEQKGEFMMQNIALGSSIKCGINGTFER